MCFEHILLFFLYIKKGDVNQCTSSQSRHTMATILLVDDDPMFRVMLRTFLSKHDFTIIEASTGTESLRSLNSNPEIQLVLTDLRLPDLNGLEVITEIKRRNPQMPIIMMTSFGDIKTAVKAIKLGAFEYVTKPVNPDEILMNIQAALKKQAAPVAEQTETKKEFVEGVSAEARKVNEFINLVAPTRMSVLIQGESGTGKEYVARQIHNKSKRKNSPFVAVDCGTLSKELAGSELFGHTKGSFTGAVSDKTGHFIEAEGGTLFLDEVGNLPYEVQVRLLRALQERKIRPVGSNNDTSVDVRILTATNEDLQLAVSEGRFREDLFHRLNEFSIRVAPLRERREDIMQFAEQFLQQANDELDKEVEGFSPDVVNIFMMYSWPGNLRELNNIVRRSTLLASDRLVDVPQLPEEMVKDAYQLDGVVENAYLETNLKEMNQRTERELIRQALIQTSNNKSKAARLLNIDRKTLYNKLKQYNID